MAGTINLQSLIYQESLDQGVPPSIALAVAQQESNTSQWNANGTLVTGTSGEVGVFQLMPATAAGLGVDATDLTQNIQGGISYLAQLFQKYGNWSSALQAYNSGSPTGSPSYASSVLAIASAMTLSDTTDLSSIDDSGDGSSGSTVGGIPLVWVAGAAVGGLGLLLWAMR